MKIKSFPISLILIITLACVALFPGLVIGNSQDKIKADEVLVIKHKNLLLLLKEGKVLKSYNAALGRKSGRKAQKGDNRTPEGLYIIVQHDADSRFYKSLHLSYPNRSDIIRSQKSGYPPGNALAIHGLPEGFEDLGTFQSKRNWTKGCIAVSNEEMDEIWELVENGTPVEIIP